MRSRGCNEYRNRFNMEKCSKREIKRIYESEKLRYSQITEFDIDFEKVNLKSCIVKCKEKITIYYMTLLVLVFICFSSLSFTFISLLHTNISIMIIDALALISSLSIIYLLKAIMKKETKQFVFYETCLLVLKDIEKEKQNEIHVNKSLLQ